MDEPVRAKLLNRYRRFCAIMVGLLLACTAMMYLMFRLNDLAYFKYAAAVLLLIGAAGLAASRCPACHKFALNIKSRRVFCKACKAEAEI